MNTQNPIIEELKKKPSFSGFFDSKEPDEKASDLKELDLSFDLDSVDLSDLVVENQNTNTPDDNYNHFDEEDDVGCSCVRFWNWLCPKR